MAEYRMMTAMVLFRFEQELGSYVHQKSPELDGDIQEIAGAIIERETKKRPDISIGNTGQLIAETYIEDLFQLALRLAKDTADYAPLVELKKLATNLSLYEIRNAVAHPNRPFPECYWYRAAAIASDPLVQQLNLKGITASLEAAIAGKIEAPPEDWLKPPQWLIPNNLPKSNDFDITGLIGRPKEITELQKYLKSSRVHTIAIVAPGGFGKTALALDVLYRACKTPEFHTYFQAVVFITLKLEKLTAEGLIKLDAPASISAVEEELANAIPSLVGEERGERTFDQIKERFGETSLLLFIDNLETVLLDDPANFNDFQIALPSAWRLIVTSRVTINSATCLPLTSLTEPHARHLTHLYSARRGAAGVFTHDVVEKVISRTRCNPLAIRLSVDAYILGSSLDDSLTSASRDVLNFSYRNLLEVVSKESGAVLECLFLQDMQTRIELAENINCSIDEVALGLSELGRTSLISRDHSHEQERYSIYQNVRDVLLVMPKDLNLRSLIQHRLLSRKEALAEDQSRQSKLSRFHYEYVEPNLPDLVRNICFETNRALRQYGKRRGGDILGLIERLRVLRSGYPKVGAIPRQLAKIFKTLGDNNTAISEFEAALSLNTDDMSAKIMLGRCLHNDRNYAGAIDAYAYVRDKGGWDVNVVDLQTARYCYNGYWLALMYSGDYTRIIEETHGWQSSSPFQDIAAAFRARAWKRSVEQCDDNEERSRALSRAIKLLDELHKLSGYPDWAIGFFCEVIRGIDDAFKAQAFEATKYASELLQFAERHITNVFKDAGDDLDAVLGMAANFLLVNCEGNPFASSDWRNFLSTKGGRIFTDDQHREELISGGFVFARVYHMPKGETLYIFASDDSGQQYFVHFESVSTLSRHLWRRVKEGTELAVLKDEKPPMPGKALRSTETIIL